MSRERFDTQKIRLSFALGAKIQDVPDYRIKNDGTMRAPLNALAAHIEWQFCLIFQKIFPLTNADLTHYTVSFAEVEDADDLWQIDFHIPEEKKLSVETMRPIYDSMNRFVNRLLKEVVDPEQFYAQETYACGKQVRILHTPHAMIAALDALLHKKYKGNPECLPNLHMARHLLERFDHYTPHPGMN